jgi:hypothetical protein
MADISNDECPSEMADAGHDGAGPICWVWIGRAGGSVAVLGRRPFHVGERPRLLCTPASELGPRGARSGRAHSRAVRASCPKTGGSRRTIRNSFMPGRHPGLEFQAHGGVRRLLQSIDVVVRRAGHPRQDATSDALSKGKRSAAIGKCGDSSKQLRRVQRRIGGCALQSRVPRLSESHEE